MKKTKEKPYRLKGEIVSFLIVFISLLGNTVQAQQSTVVIAEVMYDNPLYDNETLAPGKESEFMSLYNYGEDDVNIGGWRITVTPLTLGRMQFSFTFPANTVISESGLVVIASCRTIGSFDVGNFYGQEMPDPDSSGIRVLYTNTLAYPDTRSRIAVYDAQNRLQDELVYDGLSAAQAGSPLLRAENAVNPRRPTMHTVSISRKKIVIDEGVRRISKTDYFSDEDDNDKFVQLFNYLPEDYSETPFPSIMASPPPETLILTGTVTENNDYKAPTIESTQVIESGKTTYFAGEGITLGPGFAVRAGAEFGTRLESDSFHLITMLTYNLWGDHTSYDKHAKVIKASKADVVAVQELKWFWNFLILKDKSGYKGNRQWTILSSYGIGLLWKSSTVGDPLDKSYKKVKVDENWPEKKRAYMVAEFRDFCFVSTHYSRDTTSREKMSRKILGNSLVVKCQEKGKPIYIAGDMNAYPQDTPIQMLTDQGFGVLNDIVAEGQIIDLILEKNENQNHKTIERGRHLAPYSADRWEADAGENRISDHKPYRVKVKIK